MVAAAAAMAAGKRSGRICSSKLLEGRHASVSRRGAPRMHFVEGCEATAIIVECSFKKAD